MQITRDNLKNEHEWSVRQNKHDTKQYIYRSDGRNKDPVHLGACWNIRATNQKIWDCKL